MGHDRARSGRTAQCRAQGRGAGDRGRHHHHPHPGSGRLRHPGVANAGNLGRFLLQGLEDKVVPPNQAEKILDSLKSRGVPVAYVPFAGEQHGFRKAESIKRALEGELYFYSKVFKFDTAEELKPVQIENL